MADVRDTRDDDRSGHGLDDEPLGPLLGRAAGELKAPVRLDASFDARVMAAVRATTLEQLEGAGAARIGDATVRPLRAGGPAAVSSVDAQGVRALGDAVRWLVKPRPVRVSPLAGLAMAAGIAGIAVVSARQRGQQDVDPMRDSVAVAHAVDRAVQTARENAAVVATASAAPGARVVQFVFVAPNASAVALVGDFNDWDPAATPLRRSAAGVWSGTMTLEPGRHLYAFVVDGKRWVADPSAPQALGDDFGTPNSVITVGGSST